MADERSSEHNFPDLIDKLCPAGDPETRRAERLPQPLDKGMEASKGSSPVLERAFAADDHDRRSYLIDDDSGLHEAINTALMLRMPLLVTGKPGCGKTALAGFIAREIGAGQPLVFEVKSDTQSRDLFYEYDHLGHFYEANLGKHRKTTNGKDSGAQGLGGSTDDQLGDTDGSVADAGDTMWSDESTPPRSTLDFIQYQALGQAIILAKGDYLADDGATKVYEPSAENVEHPGARTSVVLIDEIDKAPRDLPNDILNEIDQMYFRIKELGNIRVSADPARRPVIVITSNSEKSLPEAFLRRCVYFDIPEPDESTIKRIASARLSGISETSPLLADVYKVYEKLHKSKSRLSRVPGTAELIFCVSAFQSQQFDVNRGVFHDPRWLHICAVNLIKKAADREKALEIFDEMSDTDETNSQ